MSTSPVLAVEFYVTMLLSGVEPNHYTFPFLFKSCTKLLAIREGKQVHGHVLKLGFNCDVYVHTSLINFYAQIGELGYARLAFDTSLHRDAVSFTALITGYTSRGCMDDAQGALELFTEMVSEGFKPDDITFVGVLSACNHAGLIDLGRQFFSSMIQDYNISPKLQHFGCIIDLLGRAGLFDEAETLIRSMEMKPDGVIWASLLSSCRLHNNVQLGEYVTEQLLKLEPGNHGAHVLLSNIYAGAGKWDDVARIRTKLNDMGITKVPGCTSIEVDSVVHEFVVSDRAHPHSREINKMLDETERLLALEGHVPDTSEVLYDINEELKEDVISQHSERLAVAFGLISTKPGTTIRC